MKEEEIEKGEGSNKSQLLYCSSLEEQVFNSLIHCTLSYYPPAGEMNHENLLSL